MADSPITRTVLAFIAASIAAAMSEPATAAIVNFATDRPAFSLQEAISKAEWYLTPAFGLTLIALWPFHMIALRLGWKRFRTYASFGVALGAVVFGVFFCFVLQAMRRDGQLAYASVIALPLALNIVVPCAILTSLFWLIRRPDRDVDTNAHVVFE